LPSNDAAAPGAGTYRAGSATKPAMNALFTLVDDSPRRVLALLSAGCVALLAYGLYLQHVVGLEPCPMCIVQRYALVLIAICAALTGATGRKGLQTGGAGLLLLLAGFGAFVAARQSWLQWYPPEVVSCGRDFYGMIETFPLQRAVPMIFKGGGDCTKIDWTFLGGSIANWSFLCFSGIAALALLLIWRGSRRH
jgi:protein dithiol:quinone oxidoreductase